MPRDTADKRAIRTLGVSVLAVFLFGWASGPLRTCFSHPGHASGHASELAPDHMVSHAETNTPETAPTAEHEGCSCLGQCSLEHAPLPGTDRPALAHSPTPPKALIAASGRTYAKHDPFGLPLARPPPAVV